MTAGQPETWTLPRMARTPAGVSTAVPAAASTMVLTPQTRPGPDRDLQLYAASSLRCGRWQPTGLYANLVAMGAAAVTCPRCGVRYDLPHSRQHDPHSPARPHIGADGAVSVQVNHAVVHQCQPGIDPVTGKKAWRPVRTVGADPPAT
jgi:hypothetical protein